MKRLIPFDWERRLGYDREVKASSDVQPKPGPMASPFSCVAVPVPKRPDGLREAKYVRQAVERANKECIMNKLVISDLQRTNQQLALAAEAREHEIMRLRNQLDRALQVKIKEISGARQAAVEHEADKAGAAARAANGGEGPSSAHIDQHEGEASQAAAAANSSARDLAAPSDSARMQDREHEVLSTSRSAINAAADDAAATQQQPSARGGHSARDTQGGGRAAASAPASARSASQASGPARSSSRLRDDAAVRAAVRSAVVRLQLVSRPDLEDLQEKVMEQVQVQLVGIETAQVAEIAAVKAENHTLRQLHDILNEKAELDARRLAELEARNVRLEYDLMALSEEVEEGQARMASVLLQGSDGGGAFTAGLQRQEASGGAGAAGHNPWVTGLAGGSKGRPQPNANEDDEVHDSGGGCSEAEEENSASDNGSHADSQESLVFKSPSVVPSLDFTKLSFFNRLAAASHGHHHHTNSHGQGHSHQTLQQLTQQQPSHRSSASSGRASKGLGGNAALPSLGDGAGENGGNAGASGISFFKGTPLRPTPLTEAVLAALQGAGLADSGTSDGAGSLSKHLPGGDGSAAANGAEHVSFAKSLQQQQGGKCGRAGSAAESEASLSLSFRTGLRSQMMYQPQPASSR